MEFSIDRSDNLCYALLKGTHSIMRYWNPHDTQRLPPPGTPARYVYDSGPGSKTIFYGSLEVKAGPYDLGINIKKDVELFRIFDLSQVYKEFDPPADVYCYVPDDTDVIILALAKTALILEQFEKLLRFRHGPLTLCCENEQRSYFCTTPGSYKGLINKMFLALEGGKDKNLVMADAPLNDGQIALNKKLVAFRNEMLRGFSGAWNSSEAFETWQTTHRASWSRILSETIQSTPSGESASRRNPFPGAASSAMPAASTTHTARHTPGSFAAMPASAGAGSLGEETPTTSQRGSASQSSSTTLLPPAARPSPTPVATPLLVVMPAAITALAPGPARPTTLSTGAPEAPERPAPSTRDEIRLPSDGPGRIPVQAPAGRPPSATRSGTQVPDRLVGYTDFWEAAKGGLDDLVQEEKYRIQHTDGNWYLVTFTTQDRINRAPRSMYTQAVKPNQTKNLRAVADARTPGVFHFYFEDRDKLDTEVIIINPASREATSTGPSRLTTIDEAVDPKSISTAGFSLQSSEDRVSLPSEAAAAMPLDDLPDYKQAQDRSSLEEGRAYKVEASNGQVYRAIYAAKRKGSAPKKPDDFFITRNFMTGHLEIYRRTAFGNPEEGSIETITL